MAITNQFATATQAGTGARGTSSTTVAYGGVAAGRLALLYASTKPSTATWSAISGWTNIVDVTGGTGTNAADTGPTRLGVWYRILDGTETGSVTVSTTGGTTTSASMQVLSGTLGGWAVPYAITANVGTHATNPTATSAAWTQTPLTGDWVVAAFSIDTDNTSTLDTMAFTKTNTTFGARTNRTRIINSDGTDNSLRTYDAAVTAHLAGSTDAMTATLTWSVPACGPMAFIRISECAGGISVLTDNFNDGVQATPQWDNSYGGQTETGGRAQTPATTGYSAYNSRYIYSLDSITVQAFPAAVNGATTGEVYTSFWMHAGSQPEGNQVGIKVDTRANVISFENQTAYFEAGKTTATYNATNHAWWRLQYTGGNLVWSTSPDGSTWTTQRTSAAPSWVTSQDFRLFLEAHRDSGTNNVAEWDNLNLPPASTTANAGTADSTSAAYDATVQVSYAATAGTADTSSTALDANTATGQPAGTTGTTSSALDAAPAVAQPAGTAGTTASAFDATVATVTSTTANAGTADTTSSAFDAVAQVAYAAQPGTAGTSSTAFDATVQTDVATQAGTANTSSAASDATSAVSPAADTASTASSAFDATVNTSASATASAGTADTSSAAYDATTVLASNAGAGTSATASAAFSAAPAVGPTAGVADTSNAAYDAAPAVVQPTGTADTTSTAYDATVSTVPSVTANAGTADTSSSAPDAVPSVAQPTGTASTASAAYDATVSTNSSTTANAGTADSTSAAYDAVVQVSASAGTAGTSSAALPAVVSVTTLAGTAATTSAAYNAAIQTGYVALAQTAETVCTVVSSASDIRAVPGIAETASVAHPALGVSAAAVVTRPSTGQVVRPGSGQVARPSSGLVLQSTGDWVIRPDTGIVDRP